MSRLVNHQLQALVDDLGEADARLHLGREIHTFAAGAYPICRSITGDGVRRTLELIERIAGRLEVHEVPTGTVVFDWQVPREWNVREAHVTRVRDGRRIVDFAEHNLHLLGYSVPFRGRLGLDELQEHLYSEAERPGAIPYRTSYYQERWGFCLSHDEREALEPGEYDVVVDTTLDDGHLTYGELVLPATGADEGTVLLSAHVCHPSLANDNLSALGVAAHLGRLLGGLDERRYTYRILFAPGTIGAITWLARNEELTETVRHGLVMANLGDAGPFHYKKSRRGDAVVDRAVAKVLEDTVLEDTVLEDTVLKDSVLKDSILEDTVLKNTALGDAGATHEIEDFEPFGYDERQFCSPGFDLPVGSLTRTPWGRYPEYHTSDDDLELIRPEPLGESLLRYLEVVHVLEHDRAFRNLNPKCEPQLGRRGLYNTLGGGEEGRERQLALLWVLNQSDGEHSLLDIAERAGVPFRRVVEVAAALLDAELLEPLQDDAGADEA